MDSGTVDLNVKSENERESISKIYGKKLAENLLDLNWSDEAEGINLNGLLTTASYNEDKKIFILFINSLKFLALYR